MPDSVTVCIIISHLTISITPWGRYHYWPYFKDKVSWDLGRWRNFPKFTQLEMAESEFEHSCLMSDPASLNFSLCFQTYENSGIQTLIRRQMPVLQELNGKGIEKRISSEHWLHFNIVWTQCACGMFFF